MRQVFIPTGAYQAAATVLAVLCYPEGGQPARDLYNAGMAFLIRQQRDGAFQNTDRLKSEYVRDLLKACPVRDMENTLKQGNRRLWYRMVAAEVFFSKSVFSNRSINQLIFAAEVEPVINLTDRSIRRSILEATRPVFPLTIVMYSTIQILAEKYDHPQSLETLLYISEEWVHRAVRSAQNHSRPEVWRAFVKEIPALKTTDPNQFIRLEVDASFPVFPALKVRRK